MQELTIHHVPATGRRRTRVRVSYRAQEGAQPQERDTPFAFTVTDEQRRLMQWYLEEYLLYSWGVFRTRAQEAEALMEQLGAELFGAVSAVGKLPRSTHTSPTTSPARAWSSTPVTRKASPCPGS